MVRNIEKVRTTRHLRLRSRLAIIGLGALAATVAIPATAFAGSWGPRTSSYSGIVRVKASGTLTRSAGGSTGFVSVCDQHNEGWPVYGYVNWFAYTSPTAVGSGVIHQATGQTGGCTSGSWYHGWTTFYGFWVTSAGCAQVGWPVPDNCTSAYSESHRP